MKDELLEEKLKDFHHRYSPAHLYCRLCELGLPKSKAKRLCSTYELEFYKPVRKELKKRYGGENEK